MLLVYLSLSHHFGDFLNCFAYEFIFFQIFSLKFGRKMHVLKIKTSPKIFLKKCSLKFLNDNHNKFTKVI